ncbi:MAG: hypothetical protein RJA98_2798 [Pseudomonadota bacterium]|jgi:hypothetical protein
MKKFLLNAFVAAAAVAAAPAHALVVSSVSYVAGALPVVVTSTDSPAFSYNEAAGAFEVNGSFVAYCVEITQGIHSSILPLDFTETTFGAKQADLTKAVQWMLNEGTFIPGTKEESALNQAIIWEIVYEDSGSYSFSGGDFTLAGVGAFDFSQLNSVTSYATIAKLESSKAQDLLVVTAVPEPSTYALMLAGLAGVGFLARRRRAD